MADTKWFSDARFGMFIHFGLYSIPAGVWKGEMMGRNWYAEWMQTQGNWPNGIPTEEYQALAEQFNPEEFNAEEWILEAKNAGMKYFMITTKHHDGFALWPTECSDFSNDKCSPFKRDIVGECVDACRKHGIIPGFYYSHWQDWEGKGGATPHWPEEPGDPDRELGSDEEYEVYWQTKSLAQVRELMTRYKPGLFWFDSWRESPFLTTERLDELIALVRDIDPTCLINSRIGTTWNHEKGDNADIDYLSQLDNVFPDGLIETPWETSGTFNRSWGHHLLDFEWKPAEKLLQCLIDNTSRNGNFQLNIGPMANGKFQTAAIRRLREIGAWMLSNGEAVHGCGPASCDEPTWGRVTQKHSEDGKGRMHICVYDVPADGKLKISNILDVPAKAYILETGQPVPFEMNFDGIKFTMPEEPRVDTIPVIAVEF